MAIFGHRSKMNIDLVPGHFLEQKEHSVQCSETVYERYIVCTYGSTRRKNDKIRKG